MFTRKENISKTFIIICKHKKEVFFLLRSFVRFFFSLVFFFSGLVGEKNFYLGYFCCFFSKATAAAANDMEGYVYISAMVQEGMHHARMHGTHHPVRALSFRFGATML